MKSELEKVMRGVEVNTVSEIDTESVSRLHKVSLVGHFINLVGLLEENMRLCKSAADIIDFMKSEQNESQKRLVDFQRCQMEKVQETVKTELETWTDYRRSQLAEKSIKSAVKLVKDEEKRSKNLMIYNYPETERDGLDELLGHWHTICTLVGKRSGADLRNIHRVGGKEPGRSRPIKVELESAAEVEFMLKNAHKLRTSCINNVFLGPDRTKEQTTAHRKLVEELKDNILKDPSKHYFIKNNRVCNYEKNI